MKFWIKLALSALLVLLFSASLSAQAQWDNQLAPPEGEPEVLPEAVFQARFGANPELPRTDREILVLAEKLFAPARPLDRETVRERKTCGEPEAGLLMAALQNQAVSDRTRQTVAQMMAAAPPELNRTCTLGHFKIFFTDNNNEDPRHNITRAQAEDLALVLNQYWDEYGTHFREPKYYVNDAGKKMIDIKVYFLPSVHGRTHPTWRYIEFDSLTVRNNCRLKTTAAHELFHRVQYRYGYIGGLPNVKWMSEGSAVWIQKWIRKHMGDPIIGDYVLDMDDGLMVPDKDLLVDRKEDICHFWVYLEDRTSWTAIRNAWLAFQGNGHNAKGAVAKVVHDRLGLTFDQFLHKWSKANYIKGLANATAEYDYWEDDRVFTNCTQQYGPLERIAPVKKNILTNNATFTLNGKVSPYGADYYALLLGDNVTKLNVFVQGAADGNFSYFFQGVKKNQGVSDTVYQTLGRKATYKKTLQSGQWDYLLLMVMGRSKGGNYTVSVSPAACLTGTWNFVEFGIFRNFMVFKLAQNGSDITGEWLDDFQDFVLTGTFTPPRITLKLTKAPLPSNLCNVTYTGTMSNCNSGSGTWSNSGNTICDDSGTWEMTREPDDVSLAVAEGSDPACPTCP